MIWLYTYISVQLAVSLIAISKAEASLGRLETVALSYAPIPTGLLFAQFITDVTFKVEDAYLTRVE